MFFLYKERFFVYVQGVVVLGNVFVCKKQFFSTVFVCNGCFFSAVCLFVCVCVCRTVAKYFVWMEWFFTTVLVASLLMLGCVLPLNVGLCKITS